MKIVFDTKNLLEAPHYRGFLFHLYKANKDLNSQFSYAFLAKQCHFGSKSFIKEVIDGKKNLSIESSRKITQGLSFPNAWAEYFSNLVLIDSKISLQDSLKIQKELDRLKNRLAEKIKSASSAQPTAVLDSSALFQISQWPHVYAALGNEKTGASLLEITKRTGMGSLPAEAILEFLEKEKMVLKKDRRYYALQNTVFFADLGKSAFFKKFYLQSLQSVYKNASQDFASPNSLFYTMSLSLNSNKLPKFRKDLAELLDKYTSEIEDPDGNRVAVLNCGMHLL
jgi:uncharacterized protein (TIGR02147 family)